jgi:amino acid transporter
MHHKWETNMILHTACGMLITMITIIWGFWAISRNGFNPSNKFGNGNYIGERTAAGSLKYQHSFAGIIVALMGIPLVITGFIAYIPRWKAKSNAKNLIRLGAIHKVTKQCRLTF